MKKTPAIGALVAHFRKIYALQDADNRHEAVHVMTGFGIGVADELRVAVCETALYNDYHSLDMAAQKEKKVHDNCLEVYTKNAYDFSIEETGLAREGYAQLQKRTLRLHKHEVESLYNLGIRIGEQIRALTGKKYLNLSQDDVARLDFSKVDFVFEAQKIRLAFEKAANRKIAEKTTALFYNAARPENKRKIPAAGLPWHGPHMKPYAAALKASSK